MVFRSRSRSPRRRRRSPSPPGGRRARARQSRTPSPPPHRGSKMRSDHPESGSAGAPSVRSRVGLVTGSAHAARRSRSRSRDRRGGGGGGRRGRAGSGGDYASPSPPRSRRGTSTTAAERAAIRELDELDRGMHYPARGSRTKTEKGYIFKSAEFGDVDLKEQRKIQIDIRRSIPAHRISTSPIRRNIEDPKRVLVSRKNSEGQRPIFDRDEIRQFVEEEKRSVNVLGKLSSADDRQRETDRRNRGERSARRRSASPGRGDARTRIGDDRMRSSQRSGRSSIKDRLGGGGSVVSSSTDRRERVRSRLGDSAAALNREELENLRPDVKPWDINPEYVPKGRNYFEHDDREGGDGEEEEPRGYYGGGRGGFRGGWRGRGGGGWRGRDDGGGWRGGGRGGWRGGGRRADSPKWKHDMFDEQDQEEPTSTTME